MTENHNYKHKHRCVECGLIWVCFRMECVGAGSLPPPEGYLDQCAFCKRGRDSVKEFIKQETSK